jgi:cell division protein ZapA
MSVETVEVQIFDKTYRINSPAGEQASLKQAADYLDKKMREIRAASKNMESERVAVLAALNICHELFTSKAKPSEDPSRIAQALQLLIGKIDRVIAG